MSRPVLLVAIAAAGLVSVAATRGAEPTANAVRDADRPLVAVIPRDSPPQYQLNDEGGPGGFAVEVMNLISHAAGVEVIYRIEDNWAAVIDSLRRGRADLIPNLGVTAVRERDFAFSSPLETFRISLFVRNDTHTIHHWRDLSGRKVAVVRANAAQTLLEGRSNLQLRVYPDFPDALFALLSGNVDALVYPEPWTWERARAARVADQIKTVGEPLIELKRALAVRAENRQLLSRLEPAVQKVITSPPYRQVYAKWIGAPQPYWTTTRLAVAMAVVVLLVAAGMGMWRYVAVSRLNRHLREVLAAQERAEARRQTVFQNAAVSLWEEDISEVRRLIDLERQRVTGDWVAYCREQPDFVDRCAHALRVVDVNPAAIRLYEASSKEELLGSLTRLFTDEARENFILELAAIADGERQFSATTSNRTLRGREIDVLITLSIPPPGSPAQRMIAAIVDITERRRIEQERAQLLHELERRNAEMENFVYTISHDLKAPLITIDGFAKLLVKDLARNDTGAFADSVGEIGKATAHMQTLIKDLLVLSRSGKIVGELAPVDLQALIGELAQRFQQRLQDAGATLRVVDGLPVIRADRTRLAQVFTNLIDNAIKYRRADAALRIDVGARRAGGECGIYVCDNGIGIKPQYQERIFGLFQRLENRVEGTGIGLAIARRIAEAHGGRLWVESEPGRGSCFWLSLPESVIVHGCRQASSRGVDTERD